MTERQRLIAKYNRLIKEMNRTKRTNLWKRASAVLRAIKRA